MGKVGATLHCGVQASLCGDLLQNAGSRLLGFSSCGSQTLECRFSSCGAETQFLCSPWNLPGPGIKPMSPALASGFVTTGPAGKCHFNHPYVYSSLALSTFTLSCNHHCHPPSELFHLLQLKPVPTQYTLSPTSWQPPFYLVSRSLTMNLTRIPRYIISKKSSNVYLL